MPLTDDERAEYTELGASLRHEDTLVFTGAAVVFPLSLGAVYAAGRFQLSGVALWAVAAGSLLIYVYWLVVVEFLASSSKLMRIHAAELERNLDMTPPPPGAPAVPPPHYHPLSHLHAGWNEKHSKILQLVRWGFLGVLVLLWILAV